MTTIVNGLLAALAAEVVATETLRPAGNRAVRAVAGASYGVVAGGTLVAPELLSVPPATATVVAITFPWAGVLFFLTAIAEVDSDSIEPGSPDPSSTTGCSASSTRGFD